MATLCLGLYLWRSIDVGRVRFLRSGSHKLTLLTAAVMFSSGLSAVTPATVYAQGLPIGLGVSLGMGLLSHAARHRSSNSNNAISNASGTSDGSSCSSGSNNYNPPGSSYSSSGSRRSRTAVIAVYNKAVKLFNAENYEEALAPLEQTVQVDPRMGNAFALLGVSKLKLDRYQEAMQDFVMAENYGNRYQTLLYEKGMCAAHLHDYQLARDCFQNYLAREHQGPQVEAGKKALEIVQHNFFNQSDDNYLSEAEREGTRRWNNRSTPLRVYIQEDSNLQGYHSEFAQIVKQSFDDWASGTNGKVSFAFTNDPSEAQIKCSWTDNQAELGDTKELGLTLLTFSNGVIETANIKLFTLKGFCRDEAVELFPQAKCVALHEIGHALGLQHSNESFDTMFPLAPPKGLEFPLTKRDLNTVTALYNEAGQPRLSSTGGTELLSQASRK
jgi:tetratricopeptide (TPR) repeat protein